ncbi:hypothetical protein L6Q96_22130 [Candidatus Binatia bacterium]|nr:hypothetical protein [Candidatus Binatia bacterium]
MTEPLDAEPHRRPRTHGFARTFTLRGPLAPLLGLLVLAPALLAVLSLAALLVGGGALAALLLPPLLRHRNRQRQAMPRGEADCIELDREQYRRVDSPGTPTPRP